MNKDVERILYNEQQLSVICDRVADQLNRDYKGHQVVLVGILKGSVVFLADLSLK